MSIENKEMFYIDFSSIKKVYPSEVSVNVENFGLLEQYKGNKYTLKEINEIIAKLITKVPYISGSMQLKVCVMGIGYRVSSHFSLEKLRL